MPTDATEWAETLAREFQSTEDLSVQLFQLVVIVVVIWLLRWLLLRLILRRTRDSSTTYWATKISSYVATALSILVASQIWLGNYSSLLTFFGLITAGLAIALRDPVTNMFAWLFIVWRRPFELGHRVQIGDSTGDVIDIRIFQTSLLEIGNWVDADQPTGRIIHIPNSVVFSQMQFNYSIGIPFIWDEVPVLITFESDWQKAKRLLINIVEHAVPPHERPSTDDLWRMSRTYRLSTLNTEPAVYTSVLDSGVLLTLRYTVRPQRRRGLTEHVWEDVLRAFAQHPDIDFAYPTTRFYNNRLEGPMAKLDQSEAAGSE